VSAVAGAYQPVEETCGTGFPACRTSFSTARRPAGKPVPQHNGLVQRAAMPVTRGNQRGPVQQTRAGAVARQRNGRGGNITHLSLILRFRPARTNTQLIASTVDTEIHLCERNQVRRSCLHSGSAKASSCHPQRTNVTRNTGEGPLSSASPDRRRHEWEGQHHRRRDTERAAILRSEPWHLVRDRPFLGPRFLTSRLVDEFHTQTGAARSARHRKKAGTRTMSWP
jgi:hypothetical protein